MKVWIIINEDAPRSAEGICGVFSDEEDAIHKAFMYNRHQQGTFVVTGWTVIGS